MLDVTLGILYSGANSDKKLGMNVALRLGGACSALMKEYNDLETDKTAADFYTNDFLP